MHALLLLAALIATSSGAQQTSQTVVLRATVERAVPDPVVALWYRGSPAGRPQAADLAGIRRAGFRAIVWPSRQSAVEAEVFRLAAEADLQVTLQIESVPITAATARKPDAVATVKVAGMTPDEIAPLVWRVLARGARVVAFDPGVTEGTGLEDGAARVRPWVAAAVATATDVARNAQLVSEWRAAGDVTLEGFSADAVDLAVLADARSWVLVLTNTSRRRARGTARLPAGVPAALWVDLLGGSLMSMVNAMGGPRWSLDLAPCATFVYVVNK